jgi:hypothetical protein
MITRKLGTLDPVVYFDNASGEIVLPPTTADARYFYEGFRQASGKTYRELGFEYREAGTLAEVDALQRRLVEQDRRTSERDAQYDEARRGESWRHVGDSLWARMVSSSTSAFERDFIELYLKLREEKRAKHRQRWLERTSYLWAREQNSSTIPQDRMLD